MTVLARFLGDARRSLRWWLLGMLALVAFTVAFYPSVKGQEQFDELMRDLPEAIRTMVGVQEGISLTSPAGYLQARLFSIMLPVLLMTYGIGLGARAIAGAEADGTLELLLANPVRRRDVLLQRYLGMTALLAAVTLATTLALLAMAPLVGLLDGVRLTRLAAAVTAVLGLALLHASVAFAVGAATGRPGPAVAVATSLAAAGYLVQGIASAGGGLGPFEQLSPWHWYLGRNPLAQGVTAAALFGPPLLSAALLALSERAFARRDLR